MTNLNVLKILATQLGHKKWHAPGLGEVHDSECRVIACCVDVDPVEEELRPSPALEEGNLIASFIANCDPNTVLELCAQIERLEQEVRRYHVWRDATLDASGEKLEDFERVLDEGAVDPVVFKAKFAKGFSGSIDPESITCEMEWLHWKLTSPQKKDWRAHNPTKVITLTGRLARILETKGIPMETFLNE